MAGGRGSVLSKRVERPWAALAPVAISQTIPMSVTMTCAACGNRAREQTTLIVHGRIAGPEVLAAIETLIDGPDTGTERHVVRGWLRETL